MKPASKFLNQAEKLIIQEAISGEEEAFIQLYHQNVAQLYRFIFSKVNNQEDAEDITSEAFYQALRNLKSYSGKSSFKNWLYGIAKHLILAKYRERYNQSTVELNENLTHGAQDDAMEDEQDNAEIQESERILHELMALLPNNYRSVLDLRFLKGYSIIETAHELGISEENAKVLQHRALKKANQIMASTPGLSDPFNNNA